jgi:hypothetical protein
MTWYLVRNRDRFYFSYCGIDIYDNFSVLSVVLKILHRIPRRDMSNLRPADCTRLMDIISLANKPTMILFTIALCHMYKLNLFLCLTKYCTMKTYQLLI